MATPLNVGSWGPGESGDKEGDKRQGSSIGEVSSVPWVAMLLEDSVCRPWIKSGLSLIAPHPPLS